MIDVTYHVKSKNKIKSALKNTNHCALVLGMSIEGYPY